MGSYAFVTDDFIEYPTGITELSIAEYLILVWVRKTTASHDNGRICQRGAANSTATDHMQLMVGDGSTGAFNGTFTGRQDCATTDGRGVADLTGAPVANDTWALLGVRYRDNTAYRTYKDGSNFALDGPRSVTPSGAATVKESDKFYIGSSGGSARPFGGNLAYLAAYDVSTLTDGQVDTLVSTFYNSGTGTIDVPNQDELVFFVPMDASGAIDDTKNANTGTTSGATFDNTLTPPVTYNALGGATILTPGLVTHTREVFAPTVSPQVLPGLISHTREVFAPTVSAAVTVTPDLVTHTREVFAPTVSPQLLPGLVTHAREVFALDLDTTLAPDLVTHTRAVFTPQANAGVAPDLLVHARQVFEPTIVTSAETLLPDRVDHTRQVFAPAVSPETLPDRIDHDRTVFSPTVSPTASPALVEHTRQVYAPTVVVAVLPALIDHDRQVYALTVSPELRPDRIDHTRAVYEPGIPAQPADTDGDLDTRLLPLLP